MLAQVDAAVAAPEAERDAKLAALEQCEIFEAGLIRGLRADLAPAGCADVIVEPLLEEQAGKLRGDVERVLVGLALAARLSRMMSNAPRLEAPFTKPQFLEFFESRLKPWMAEQAAAIYEISALGATLSGYAKGVVAVQAGIADLAFVEFARDVPLPEEMAKDEEVKSEYYMFLEQALDPRKDRGRDAALVGLREFAEEGILHDARLDQARALLSKLYAGRRIDALDRLLLPALPAFKPQTAAERLAKRLPTYYAGFLLKDQDPTDAGLLRALLEMGVPPAMRAHLESAKLSAASAKLYARALVELGQRYFRSRDFAKARRIAPEDDPEARLMGALASALEGGPKDAAEMMLKGPFLPAGVGNVRELDKLAQSGGTLAGMAAFDAAYLLALVAPHGADASYFRDVAERFKTSMRLLREPEHRKLAKEGAQAAEQTARALE
jgi:hypothetical protein